LWIAKKHSINPDIKPFWIVVRDVIPAIPVILVIRAIVPVFRINNATSSLILKLNPIIFSH
jgi:hypothetical protein